MNRLMEQSIQAESCKAIPADRNFLALNRLVFSDQSHLMREGLGNQQEVKRIFVILSVEVSHSSSARGNQCPSQT